MLVKRDLQSALANIAKIETQKMSLDFCEKDFYEFFERPTFSMCSLSKQGVTAEILGDCD